MRKLLYVVIPLGVLAAVGCSQLKAGPAEDTGFLPNTEKLMEDRARYPFNAVYVHDKERFSKLKETYNKIFIKNVDTSFLKAQVEASGKSEKQKAYKREELDEIALYMKNHFLLEIKHFPKHPLKIVKKAGDKTFVLELALAEVEPTNPALNATGTALGFFVPGGGLISRVHTGRIAMEGIVRDGKTGDIMVEFKDRENDKAAPFTLKDYQLLAHAREAIDDWAAQFAELSATALDHKVEDSLPFTVEPY